MSFHISGKLHKIFDTEHKTNTFQAREFVITVNENGYDQFIKFQLTQDRCDLMEHHSEGDQIEVHFDLKGREWNGKYFTNLNAWKITSGQGGMSAGPSGLDENSAPRLEEQEMNIEDFDLPF